MKFITICLTVCAIALTLSVNCANSQTTSNDGIIPRTTESREAKYIRRKTMFVRKYNDYIDSANSSWMQCNEAFGVLRSQNKLDPYMSSIRKCLIDCTLRSQNWIPNDHYRDGDDQYMKYIKDVLKEIRDNYTSTLNESKRNELKELDEFREMTRGMEFFAANGTCEKLVGPLNTDEYYFDLCYIMLGSHTQLAGKCWDLRDPYGDKCQTSYMQASCLIQRKKGKIYEHPFYIVFNNIQNAYAVAWHDDQN